MISPRRPHVIINVAMTLDGKLDSVARQGAAISSADDWARVDRLRASCDAIMVGAGTLRQNDPRLTIKTPALQTERVQRGLPPHPAKVGVMSRLALAPASRFFTYGPATVILATSQRTPAAEVQQWQARGAVVLQHGDEQVDLPAVLADLRAMGHERLLVEGGGTLIASLLSQRLVDEVLVYVAPLVFGGATAPTLADGPGLLPAQAVPLQLQKVERLEDDGVLLHYRL